jgi:hypothetical protein
VPSKAGCLYHTNCIRQRSADGAANDDDDGASSALSVRQLLAAVQKSSGRYDRLEEEALDSEEKHH